MARQYEERIKVLKEGEQPITGSDTIYGNHIDKETGEIWRNVYTVDITHKPHQSPLESTKAMVHYEGSVKDFPDQQDELLAWCYTYKKLRVKAFNISHAVEKAKALLRLKYKQMAMKI